MTSNSIPAELFYRGYKTKIYPLCKIVDPQNLFIDDFSVIDDFTFILATDFIKIGKYCHLAPYSILTGGGKIYVGDFTDISYGVKIISGSDDIFGPWLFTTGVPDSYRNIERKDIEIASYCVIGANSIIYPGVKIPQGTVVNPGTIVTSQLKAWHIYQGPACECLGKRKHREAILEKGKALLHQGRNPGN